MDKDKKKIILDFIKKHKICVLSTIHKDGSPESAVVEFGESAELEIIFDTLKTYRKYKNLKENPKVAVVIGWDENVTVQYEGEASELKGEEVERYKKFYFDKNPEAQRWENDEGITYFRIIPKWIRYSDLRVHPWEVFELKL